MIRLNFRRPPNAAPRLASDQLQAELFMDFCGQLTQAMPPKNRVDLAAIFHERVEGDVKGIGG